MKTSWKLRLALALMVAAVLAVTIPVFAAEGDGYTVSGKYLPGSKAHEGLPFCLYKIGDCVVKDGKAVLVLDDSVKDAVPEDFNLDVVAEVDSEQWTKDWLEKAKIIDEYLPDDTEKACDSVTTDENGEFSFAPIENGLYLLVNDEWFEDPEKDQDGNTVYWHGLPMLVLVLNGDVEREVKPEMETEAPDRYIVVKSWQDTGNQKARPKEIKVEIYYDYKTGQKNEPIETVTLNADNNWCYSWSTDDEKYQDKTEDKYTVKEVITADIKKNYTLKESESMDQKTNTKRFNITNVYNTGDKGSGKSSSKVKTGDTNKMNKYYVICAAALIVLIILFIASRKRRKDDGQA